MRNHWLFAVPLCIALGGTSLAQPQCNSRPTSEVLEAAMKARSEIKPGDYRASLSSKWDEDGGLQFMSETRYVFRQCPLLQISVKFDVVNDGDRGASSGHVGKAPVLGMICK